MVKKTFVWVLSMLLCYAFAGTAGASSGPLITHNPVGGVIKNLVLAPEKINIFVEDDDRIDPASIVLKINDEVISHTFQYQYVYIEDTCGGYYSNEVEYTSGVIFGPKLRDLKNGHFDIHVRVSDGLGNVAEKIFSFQIAVPPKVISISPKNGEVINIANPILTFTIDTQMSNGVDGNLSVLTVDGQDVLVEVTATGIKAQLSELTDGEHTVWLLVYDTGGASVEFTSKFITTSGEMVINAAACGSCHTLDSTNRMIHSPPPKGNCGHCHVAAEYKNNGCDYCHSGTFVSVTSPQYSASGDPYTHPEPSWWWQDNPVVYSADCRNCHTTRDLFKQGYLMGWERFFWTPYAATSPVAADYPYDPAPESPYPYVHRIFPLHESSFGDSSCGNCHSTNLTRAHSNKMTDAGTQFECATCHRSTDGSVLSAILAKEKACEACHLNADHDSVHISTLNSNCTTSCHEKTLTKDHLFRADDGGNNNSCDTCHKSNVKSVVRTVSAKRLNCAGCHIQSHGVMLVDSVPDDIPLNIPPDPGFRWSTPMEASLFVGDSAFPEGYVNGQVLISSRRKNITADQVWQFYTTELAARGWALKRETYVSAEYEKNGRFATILCYNTQSRTGLGSPLVGGYRVEIWYK